MKFDRFDFEQAIMTAWNGNDDLDFILQTLENEELNMDEVMNLVIGIKELQNKKFKKIWDMFQSGISEGKII